MADSDARSLTAFTTLSMSEDIVFLTRAEYEALLERIEDAEDNAVLDAVEARERRIGKDKARADHLPAELVRRLVGGEHPVRVWRVHRGLTGDVLAAEAGIAPSYLREIETGRKPGSFTALAKLARALRVSLDDFAAWLGPRPE